jgi:hypothetical protein
MKKIYNSKRKRLKKNVVFIPLERILLGGVGFQEIEKLSIIIYLNSMSKPNLLVD